MHYDFYNEKFISSTADCEMSSTNPGYCYPGSVLLDTPAVAVNSFVGTITYGNHFYVLFLEYYRLCAYKPKQNTPNGHFRHSLFFFHNAYGFWQNV